MKLQFFVSCLFLVSAGSALAQAPLYDIPGAPNGGVRGMSAVGDLDGDGLGDLLIGSPFADGLVADSGIVRVISSKTTGTVLTLKGEHASDYFGWSVAGLDDINGDGVDEIVVGAPGHDWSATVTDSGAVYLFSGANGALIKKFNWGNDGEEYGHSVCAIGDYNLDGKADFAIGVPKGLSFPAVEGGNVIPISGATLNQLAFIESYGLFEHFGRSIARVGDLNGDGREEFIVGAPDYDAPGAVDAGRAMVLAGGSGTVLFTVTGTQVNQKLGTSVGGVADVNGDGKNEFAVGEPNYTSSFQNSGRARVFSGASGGLLRAFVGGAASDFLGASIAGLDDFDGDGRGDIVIGSYGYDNPPNGIAGKVEVYSVQTGQLLTAWVGYETFSAMGTVVASAGDLNNDGATEVIGAAVFGSIYVPGGGYARVHLGKTLTPENYCVPKVNSLGCSPGITYGGGASLSLGSGIAIVGVNVIPGQNGVMIWSLSAASVPFFGGTLCLGAPIVRTPVQPTTTNNGYPCTGQYYFQFDQAYIQSQGLSAGLDVYSQYWSRDSGFSAPNNIGLTNGLHFEIVP